MRLRGKLIAEVTQSDLEALIESKAAESTALDFKRELPKHSDAGRKDFVADVTSFANTRGGVIVFGMDTMRGPGSDTRIAHRLVPIAGMNFDDVQNRLLSMARDAVNPPLTTQVGAAAVQVDGGHIVCFGVQKSLTGPHMVTAGDQRRFWRRNDSGKYPPDTVELRAMFLESKEWLEEVSGFRTHRLAYLASGNMNVPTIAPVLVVHVVPLGRMDHYLDLTPHTAAIQRHVCPMRAAGISPRFNLDGYLLLAMEGTAVAGYTQVFRSGAVEGFTSDIVSSRRTSAGATDTLFASVIRTASTDLVLGAVTFMNTVLALDPPFAVLLSLLRVRGYRLANPYATFVGGEIDRDDLHFPAVLIENVNTATTDLQPLYDMLWQAAGTSRAP